MKTTLLSRGAVPVLCLHGFLGAPSDWENLGRALNGRYSVRACALPGHGSPLVRDFVDAVRAVQRVVRSLPAPPHLIGYSMGGRIALAAALDLSLPLASLTVISASPGLRTGAERAERMRLDERLADALERRGLENFVRDWYDQPLFASLRRRPALLRELLSRRAAGSASDRAAALRALSVAHQPSLWGELPALIPRALFVAGAADAKYREALAWAAGLSPRARLLTVPDAGHMPHLERPEFVHAAIREFLEEE